MEAGSGATLPLPLLLRDEPGPLSHALEADDIRAIADLWPAPWPSSQNFLRNLSDRRSEW